MSKSKETVFIINGTCTAFIFDSFLYCPKSQTCIYKWIIIYANETHCLSAAEFIGGWLLELSKVPQVPDVYHRGILAITDSALSKLMVPGTLFCKTFLRSHINDIFLQINLENSFLQSSTSLSHDFSKPSICHCGL